MSASIRIATTADAAGILAIYGPVIEHTPISFELEVPSEQEIAGRITHALERAPWLVAEEGGTCLGYAYGVPFRARPAYAWTIETSVYVAEHARRRGVARALCEALLDLLRLQGFHMAVAGVTLPNEASVALHESLGFTPVGRFERTGFKFGAWHAVGFWELQLQELPTPPPPTAKVSEVLAQAPGAAALAAAAARIR